MRSLRGSCVTAAATFRSRLERPQRVRHVGRHAESHMKRRLRLLLALGSLCASSVAWTGPSRATSDESAAHATLEQKIAHAAELIQKNRYAEAESIAALAVHESESVAEVDSFQVASALATLANARIGQGRSGEPETLELAQRSLAITSRRSDPHSLEVAERLNLVGRVYLNSARNTEAADYFRRVIAIREDLLTEDHADVATAVYNLGLCNWGLGHFDDAAEQFNRSLRVRVRVFGEVDWRVARSQLMLASTQHGMGDYPASLAGFRRAVATYEKTLGREHPEFGYCLNNFGNLLRAMGDYPAAVDVWEQAVALRESTLGRDHWLVGQSLNNLATGLSDMGEYEKARQHLERAVAIGENSPDPAELSFALTNLGYVLSVTGDPAGTIRYYERALGIIKDTFGADHWRVAESLVNFARVLLTIEEYEQARRFCEQALPIYAQALKKDHPMSALCAGTLGEALLGLREYASARAHVLDALRRYENAYGSAHNQVGFYLNVLAQLDSQMGDVASALRHAKQAEQVGRDHLRVIAKVLPERQALNFARVRFSGLDLLLTLAARGVDGGSRLAVWNELVQSRAMVLDEMARRNRTILTAGDPSAARLWSELVTARTRLANLSVRGTGEDPEQYRILLDKARELTAQAERALAEASTQFRSQLASERIDLHAVKDALEVGTALVGFAVYDAYELHGDDASNRALRQNASSSFSSAASSYVTFIHRGGNPVPQVVPLGNATEIDSLISAWTQAMRSAPQAGAQFTPADERRLRDAGTALRERVWDPLSPHLRDVERVFMVPDGAMHLVSFAALPVGDTRYLVEDGPLVHYLSAERDVVMHRRREQPGEGLLVMGGPWFDGEGSTAVLDAVASVHGPQTTAFRGARAGCDDFESLHFEPLPSTAAEARDVVAVWRESHGLEGSAAVMDPDELLEVQGADASEAMFKAMAPGRRVLHVATHGFFLDVECPSAARTTRGIGGIKRRPSATTPSHGNNPLLLSGLALAGANHRNLAGSEEEDGILTAQEIAALDLRSVEWAVLSACDTGVGEVETGEGVLGLRRAFEVAGARTLIMSLWAVEDEPTREWMRALYELRLLHRKDTAECVRGASLRVLNARRDKSKSTHPFYWAGFVATGNY